MRGVTAFVAVLAGLAVPAARGAPPTPVPPVTLPAGGVATATAVPATAGARPVKLTLTLRYEMQCGRPGPGPVVVSLPAAERVPHTLARRDVSLGGKPPVRASISGHVVVLTLPPQRGIICDVIGPGILTIAFAPAAGLGNPSAAGSYAIAVRVGARAFVAHLAVAS